MTPPSQPHTPEGDLVRIWSGQWRMYWRPKAQGYTSDLDDAGLYTKADALSWLQHDGPEKKLEIR